ncbi:hypothetical protein [Caballeronia sp. AZ7_KS35]|uniref:hypothetical protein n=1 Tax=Caballeronia sp. AZ7_KS35 TaxID=2921762 RepID=UPI0020293BE3|nr:hypothetical protein [Caballeronia sp. AZ7_KS35]
MTQETTKGRRPDFIVFHAPERKNAPWVRIGAMWASKDGKGFTQAQDYAPLTPGVIIVRPNDEEAGE